MDEGTSRAQDPPRLSRRQLLGAAGLLGFGSFMTSPRVEQLARRSMSSHAVALARATAPAGSDLGAIEHVVFLMQENRSFDHYFGTYPGVRGFDDHPPGSDGVFAQPYPANTTRSPEGVILPFHMDTTRTDSECTSDLTHAWTAQHQCWNGGKMDSFVKVHAASQNEGPVDGLVTMGYYTRSDIPYYYALADAFTICDNYHCSVMGPTHPNRLMSLSASIDPSGSHGGPVLVTNGSPDALWSVDWPTMPEALEDAGVSWKCYSAPGGSPAYDGFVGMEVGDPILPYFRQYQTKTSPLFQKAFLPIFPHDFIADVASGSLPAVSWIISENGYDEHPPSPASLGEFFTSLALRALVANPEVWAKTVLFVMYDENDGFFDHVAPPVPPAGTPGEYVTARPLPSEAGGIDGPIGLGFRVPMLVLSPFARGGHIASGVFDHTSQLRFIETRWGVEVPNLSAWRRRVTGDLTSALRVGEPDASVPPLPDTSDEFSKLEQCSAPEIFQVSGGSAPQPPPAQSMPTQAT
jgi:phospholipase C